MLWLLSPQLEPREALLLLLAACSRVDAALAAAQIQQAATRDRSRARAAAAGRHAIIAVRQASSVRGAPCHTCGATLHGPARGNSTN
jgi:hypothetical protein